MKYYKDTDTNELYAYESDGSQDEYIKPDLVLISKAEAEEPLAEIDTQTSSTEEYCKSEAKQRLEDTDWTQLTDVSVKLLNKDEFDAYRVAVRVMYFNPVIYPVWPKLPDAIWITD